LFLFVVKHGTPTLDELEELGVEIVEKWIKLGRRLDVSDAELQEIKQGHDQLSEKGYYMLKHWRQKKGSAATYQALCDGLKHRLVQRQDLAEKFCYTNGNYSLQYLAWVYWSNGFECARVWIKQTFMPWCGHCFMFLGNAVYPSASLNPCRCYYQTYKTVNTKNMSGMFIVL